MDASIAALKNSSPLFPPTTLATSRKSVSMLLTERRTGGRFGGCPANISAVVAVMVVSEAAGAAELKRSSPFGMFCEDILLSARPALGRQHVVRGRLQQRPVGMRPRRHDRGVSRGGCGSAGSCAEQSFTHCGACCRVSVPVARNSVASVLPRPFCSRILVDFLGGGAGGETRGCWVDSYID